MDQKGAALFSSLLYWVFFRPYADAVILFVVVSASWRGGDRRPGGAAAPTPPGSSSRALRGTAGGRRPYDARRKEEKGRPEGKSSPVSDGCPKAGLGVVGGKGLASPLPPAPRREATRPRCRAEAAVRRTSQKKQKQRLLPASNRAGAEYAAVQGKNSFHLRSGSPSPVVDFLASCQSLRWINRGRLFSSPAETGFPSPFCRCRHPVCCRKRVMARRRSPPRVGGSSDAAPGSSSRALRGTAGGRRPYDARRKEEKGRPEGKSSPVSDGCPKAGLGVVGGKGLASPLPPAPRREATRLRCRAEAVT